MRRAPLASPRKCIFCGSRRNITREHVLPDWLRNVVPRVTRTTPHSGIRVDRTNSGKVIVRPILHERPGNVGNRKLFMVCKVCNTGWMRSLQDETKPILAPLITGKWDNLTASQAEKVAAWSAMTTSVIAMSFPDTLGVTSQEREFISTRFTSPPNWMMWLGRASGFSDLGYSNRVLTVGRSEEDVGLRNEPNTVITTIVLGQLIVHVASAPFADILPDANLYGTAMGLHPILPFDGGEGWRDIPIIHAHSVEFNRVRDALYEAFCAKRTLYQKGS